MALTGVQEDEQKMRIVHLYLRDQARLWYNSLQPGQKNNLQNFRNAFLAQFAAPEQRYVLEQELMDRKMKPTETAEQYIREVRNMADKLQWDQDRVMRHLIAGLTPKLKPDVILANPQTLPDTIIRIKLTESARKSVDTTELSAIEQKLDQLVECVNGTTVKDAIAPTRIVTAPMKRKPPNP